MKQEISALMDGELFEDEAEGVLDRIRRNPEARQEWEVYHLIGDVLRQPEHIHSSLSAKVRERMQDEPIVLVPRAHAAKRKVHAVALSAAASLAAIGVVAWMSVQVGPEAPPQLAMRQPAALPASAQIRPESNDYLMAHQEFAPSTQMSGGASYIRTVAYGQDKK